MGRLAEGGFGGFHDGFRQRGVGVNTLGHIAGDGGHFHGENALGDQFSRTRTDDAHAQHALGFWVHKQFGQTLGAVQSLGAARRATAAVMRELAADPMRRLAGHYEHQPYVGRPAGETSTKSDPHGVDMVKERPRVAALMKGDDMPTVKDVWTTDGIIPAPGAPKPGTNPDGTPVNTHWSPSSYVQHTYAAAVAARDAATRAFAAVAQLAGKDLVDEAALAKAVLAGLSPEAIAAAVAAAVPPELAHQVVDEIHARLGA